MSNITMSRVTPAASEKRHALLAAASEAAGQGNALVLSAGGLFTAYQAGVYKALWPYWKPDLVVGASAGALNAWLIAARIEPDELIELWFHPDSAAAIKIRERPSLRRGYFDPDPLLDRARQIHKRYERKLPLGVVSVEFPRLRPRVFRDEEITPEHLLASCSIPLLYPSVCIGRQRLLDGGLLESTPLWAAATMGASRILAVNALTNVTPWPIRLLLRGIHGFRKIPVTGVSDVSVLRPSGAMGSAREAIVWDEGNIRRWVEMGIRDGEQFLTTRGLSSSWGETQSTG